MYSHVKEKKSHERVKGKAKKRNVCTYLSFPFFPFPQKLQRVSRTSISSLVFLHPQMKGPFFSRALFLLDRLSAAISFSFEAVSHALFSPISYHYMFHFETPFGAPPQF